jgi:hypothetical protein
MQWPLLRYARDLFDDSGDVGPQVTAALAAQLGASHPYVAETALARHARRRPGGCDDDTEFAFALDFIHDGLARLAVGP